MSGIYTLLSASKGQQRRLESISNNLANINTPGYKGDKAIFREYLDEVIGQDLESEEEQFVHHEFISPFSRGGNSYVLTDAIVQNMKEGNLRQTNNPLDFAIGGKGFFVVQTPQGERYTRNGEFTLDKDGFLVTQNGHKVLGSNGPIRAERDYIEIGEDGTLTLRQGGTALVAGQKKDRIRVVNFPGKTQLNKMGHSYWATANKDQKPQEMKQYTVHQGMLEDSNVSTVSEMVNMITVNRAFEASQKGIRTVDALDEKSIGMSKV